MKKLLPLILFGLFVVLFSSSVEAKDAPVDFQVKEKPKRDGVDQEVREKLNFIRQLMRDRNYDGATAMLEVLYETHPDNQVLINLLKQCYDQQQYFQKSEELLRRQVKLHPDNLNYWVSLAESVSRQGRDKEAIEYYQKAKAKIQGQNQIRFQIIIQSMLSHDLDTEAEKFISHWRSEYNDLTLMGKQMGTIHERHKEYLEAITEYYVLLSDTSRIGNDVEKKVLNLLKFEDSAPIVESYLLEQPDLFINQRGVKILSSHYLQTGAYDQAFDFTKTRDSLEQLDGNTLVMYMKNCNNRKLYSETIRMGEYLHKKYPSHIIRNKANFLFADALIQLGQYEKALTVYDSVFSTTEVKIDKSNALYQSGLVYQEYLFDIPQALMYYDSVCTKYPFGFGFMNSLIIQPYCYLQIGDIENARAGYKKLLSRRLSDDVKEKIEYYIALVNFIDKQVDSSRTQLSKLVIDNPKGYFVNDALELMKIIDEGKESETALHDYSNALFFEIQREYDSVFHSLNLIASNQKGILADFALFKLINYSTDFGDTSKAISYIDSLSEKFPDSYYMPYGLKKKADIYFIENSKSPEAVELYKLLLEKHTNYPFISEIRAKLRFLAENESA